jgi:biopolymer transport protein ExbB
MAADADPGGAAPNDVDKFFFAGGWLVWCVLLPLSVVTVSMIVQNCLVIRRKKLIPPQIALYFSTTNPSKEKSSIPKMIGSDISLLSRAAMAAHAASPDGIPAMENAVTDVLEQDATRLFRKIEWLHIIGNVAPMLGLFGTVWGMINAFNAIVQAGGQPEPAQLAGGISTALVTTWWGLIVAIPALAAYGILRNRIDTITADITLMIENHLHALEKK